MANYIIARIENYKMHDVGGIGKEQTREPSYIEKYYKNKDYDAEKTKDNITLLHDSARDNKTWEKYILDYRVENNISGRLTVKGSDKSQTNVVTQFLVTATSDYLKDMDRAEQIRFFKNAFSSLQEQYPSYHWIEVTVHMDEKTPHLHALALPLFKDKNKIVFSTTKTQEGKEHYREFQNRLYEDMTLKFGYNLNRGQEGSSKEHLSVCEFKKLKDKEKELEHERAMFNREREAFEKEKKLYDKPLLKKTLLGEKYSKEEVERVVEERNIAYRKIEELQEKNRQLYSRNLQFAENIEKALESARGEHEYRLELQDNLQDKEYLQERIRELEKEEMEEKEREEFIKEYKDAVERF